MKHTIFHAILALSTVLVATPCLAQAPLVHSVARVPSMPPWLGVALAKHHSGSAPGVRVSRVFRKSPAAAAGLKTGDVIIAVDGTPVRGIDKLKLLVRAHQMGQSVKLTIRRPSGLSKVAVKLAAMPTMTELLNGQLLGHSAPSFQMKIVSPKPRTATLKSFAGKPLVLDFWATWCEPCRVVSGQLDHLKQQFGARIHILGVSGESVAVLQQYVAKFGAHYTLAHDIAERGEDAFFVRSYPMIVVLDAQQKVRHIFIGSNHQKAIEAAVAKLVRGKKKAGAAPRKKAKPTSEAAAKAKAKGAK